MLIHPSAFAPLRQGFMLCLIINNESNVKPPCSVGVVFLTLPAAESNKTRKKALHHR